MKLSFSARFKKLMRRCLFHLDPFRIELVVQRVGRSSEIVDRSNEK